MPMFSVSNAELAESPTCAKQDRARCLKCETEGPIVWGKSSDTGEESMNLGALRCPCGLCLVVIGGQFISHQHQHIAVPEGT